MFWICPLLSSLLSIYSTSIKALNLPEPNLRVDCLTWSFMILNRNIASLPGYKYQLFYHSKLTGSLLTSLYLLLLPANLPLAKYAARNTPYTYCIPYSASFNMFHSRRLFIPTNITSSFDIILFELTLLLILTSIYSVAKRRLGAGTHFPAFSESTH